MTFKPDGHSCEKVMFWKIFRVFQPLKMKLMIVALAMTTLVVMQACQEKTWRGHIILCCRNGSAVKNRGGQWHWIKERPIICGPMEYQGTKQMSIMSVLAVIFGTLSCIGCHIYYLIGWIFYRFVRARW